MLSNVLTCYTMLKLKKSERSINDASDLDLDERTSVQIDKETNQLLDNLKTFPFYDGRSKKWILRHLITKEIGKLKKVKEVVA